MEVKEQEDYIGDGVYVAYDGYGIQLGANDARHPTDMIYLEPDVLEALNRFAVRVGMKRRDIRVGVDV